MSFDGSTIVKINNPKLKALLEAAEKKGLCIKPFMENSKYDFSVESYDCSLGEGCPTDLDDLRDYILQLIEVVNDFDHYQDYWFKKVFEDEYPNLKDSFTYVSWAYVPADYEKSDYNNEDILEFKYGKPGRKKASNKKNNGPSALKDIFPGIDMTKPSGLVIDDDGCCTGYDWKQHAEFLGEENCLFITKDVKTIDDEDYEIFDLLTTFDKCVVTTDLEDFGDYIGCGGFHLFYIVDAETNKVVYSSEKDEFFSNEPGFPSDWDGPEEELYKVLCKYTKCGDSNCSEKVEEELAREILKKALEDKTTAKKSSTTSAAKTSSAKSTSTKSTKKNGPSTLKEIFPAIDMTKPSGLVIDDDGCCKCYDLDQHAEFLGEENSLFITKTVKTMEDDETYLSVGDLPDNCVLIFNYAESFDKCVVTTNLEDFGPFYDCSGFHLFYIIDAKTNKVVYSSEKDEFCAEPNETDMEPDVVAKLYKVLEKYTKCDGSKFYGEIEEEDDEDEKEEEDTSTSPQDKAEDLIDDAEARAESWMQYYGEYIDSNPVINFDGSLFVFTGFGHRSEKDNPIVQKVIEKGGQYRSKVSGLTNYLVVNPREAGDTKVDAAIEQRNNGKNIQIVLLEDLEKALEGKIPAKKSSTTSTKTTAAKTTSSKSTSIKSTTKSDSTKSKRDSSSSSKRSIETSKSNELCDIDDTGRLTRYRGREKDIVLPSGIKIIGKRTFERRKTTSIVIPEGVETIEAYAFSYCQNLNSVTLPNTIKKIGEHAFYWCEQLTSIIIPEGVETIDESAFESCRNLKSVALPNTIKIIGKNAFTACEQLTSIMIPEGVETIDDYAFSLCYNLKSVTLPNTLKKIGIRAFRHCEQLKSIVIPDGVETIGNGDFYNCFNLDKVVLPSKLNKIEDEAFYSCQQLTMIIIPEGCEEIGHDAFYKCKKLKDIYVPDSVRHIGVFAFETENYYTTVHTISGSYAHINSMTTKTRFDFQYPPSDTATRASSKTTYTPVSSSRSTATSRDSSNYNVTSGSSSFVMNPTETSESNYDIDYTIGWLKNYLGREKDLVLPEGIKIIGISAFEYGDITSVVIPEGCETIEDSAFSNCKNLKSVTLPNTIKKIGKSAFNSCEQLTSIVIPEGCVELGDSAFWCCGHLKSVTLPNTLKKIGECTFNYCSQLTSILIPKGVETIDDSAFSDCINLKSVTFPNTLKKIGEYAFNTCEQLTSVVIPEGVDTIEKSAFSECINIKSVTLPNTIKKIGTYAFSNCQQLTRVVIPNGCEELGEHVFLGCDKLKDIYIPDSVYKISDNTLSYGGEMIIHTTRGSKAERCAKENEIKVVYESSLYSSASTVSSKTKYTPASSSRVNTTSSSSPNSTNTSNDSSKQPNKNGFHYFSYFLIIIGVISFIISCVIYGIDPDTVYATGRYGTGIVHHSNPYFPWFRYIGLLAAVSGFFLLVCAPNMRKSKKKDDTLISTTNVEKKAKKTRAVVISVLIALVITVIAIGSVSSYINNAPYREMKNAITSGEFDAAWIKEHFPDGIKYDEKFMGIIAETLTEYHNKNLPKEALDLLNILFESGFDMENSRLCASRSFVDWICDTAMREGRGGSIKGRLSDWDKDYSSDIYKYVLYDYQLQWSPNMVQPIYVQIYIPSQNKYYDITDNSHYHLDSSDKIIIG